MKAVIMAGGFGTRMRPLTINLPKPMIPMVNRPIMEIIVDLLKKHKLTDLISVVFYQPEVITEYFRDGADFGVKMQYKAAESDLGTAGSVKNCQSLIEKRTFRRHLGRRPDRFRPDRGHRVPRKKQGQGHHDPDPGGKSPGLRGGHHGQRTARSSGSWKSPPGARFFPTRSIRAFTSWSPKSST